MRAVLPMFAVLAFAPAGAGAEGPAEIEGVWSFNGGAVGVQALSDGTFQGIIVSPTTLAVCEHPVGQAMWTAMKPRPDGSYWGLHQWFHGKQCEVNPDLGRTAWRVKTADDGSRVLIVCLSKPGDDSQPTIAPDGATANASYGCLESSPLAALPGGTGSPNEVGFKNLVIVPSATSCKNSLALRLRNPRYDPLKEVLVKVDGKKVVRVRGAMNLRRNIVLRDLPEGKFRVRIVATTVLDQRFARTRLYRGCRARAETIGTRGSHRHSHH